jgi:hypothetical protein
MAHVGYLLSLGQRTASGRQRTFARSVLLVHMTSVRCWPSLAHHREAVLNNWRKQHRLSRSTDWVGF